MMSRRGNAESQRRRAGATGRAAERRQREREASLLRDEVPALVGLSIEVKEGGQGLGMPDLTYIRRFALETAPALFLLACGEPLCEGGGHDISAGVMEALRAGRAVLRGETRCHGLVGAEACTRNVRFIMTATFEDPLRVRSSQAPAVPS